MIIELKEKNEICKIGKIFVFSNIDFSKENTPDVCEDDLCVFINKAIPLRHYRNHLKSILFHRSPRQQYGKEEWGIINKYVFGAGAVGIPRETISKLRDTYNWNYDVYENQIRSMTTGYMVVKHFESIYPSKEIILVNFGFGVKNSTYRCPLHNWNFEAVELKKFKHIYTN